MLRSGRVASSLSHCPLAYPSGLPFSELKTSKTHRLSRRLSEGFMSLSALRKRPQKNSALPGFWLGDHIQLCSPSLPFAWIEDFSFPFRMSRMRAPPPTGLRGETADTELEGEPTRSVLFHLPPPSLSIIQCINHCLSLPYPLHGVQYSLYVS